MTNLRWLELRPSDPGMVNHPAGVMVPMQQYSVVRVLQVFIPSDYVGEAGKWIDVPVEVA